MIITGQNKMVAWPLVHQISRLRFTAVLGKIMVYQFHGSMIKYAFFNQFTYRAVSIPDMIKIMLINLPLTMMRMRMTTMTAATTMLMTRRRWTSRTRRRKRKRRMRIILVMVMMMTVILVPHL